MLAVMRKYFKKLSFTLWLVIFSFIGTIFLVWGRGSDQGVNQENLAAMVYDYPLTRTDFYRMARMYENQYRQYYGDNFERFASSVNFPALAMNGLIERALYLREADRRNITVSEQELQSRITSNPAFQENGIFSMQRYQAYLRASNWFEASAFEKFMRDSLRVEKVASSIRNIPRVSYEEIRAEYQRKSDRRVLTFVLFRNTDYEKDIKPDESTLKQYFEENKDNYVIPDKLKVKYIFLDFENLKKITDVSGEDLDDYYSEHMDEYAVPETVSASHILVKLDPKASEEDAQKAKEKIESIKKEIDAGLDFGEAAKKYSDDPMSGKEGGSLGKFKKGDMVPEFEEVAFSLETGKLSDPIKTAYGYHLIKVTEKQPARTKTLDEVKDSITEIIKTQIVEEKAEDLLYEIEEMLFEDPDLSKVSDKFKDVVAGETDYFAYDDPPKDIFASQEFAETAFKTYHERFEFSETIKSPRGYYVVSPIDLVEQHKAAYEEVAETVKKDYVATEAGKLARGKADAFHKKLTETNDWDATVKEMQLEDKVSQPFGREGYITNLGKSEAIDKFVFSHEKGAIGPVEEVENKFCVFKITETQGFTPAGFKSEYNLYYSTLISQKQEKYITSWLEKQKETAKSLGQLKQFIEISDDQS